MLSFCLIVIVYRVSPPKGPESRYNWLCDWSWHVSVFIYYIFGSAWVCVFVGVCMYVCMGVRMFAIGACAVGPRGLKFDSEAELHPRSIIG